MRRHEVLPILVAAMLAAPHVRADPIAAPEVAVKSRQPSMAAAESRGLPIVTLGRKEIEQSNARTAGDVLSRVPGVQVDGPTNQRDRNKEIRMRGLEPRYTLALVDGERVASNDGRGTFDFSSVPVEAVERFEIVKGPQAVIYGSDAIGGVVNVVTRDIGKTGAEASVGAGSFSTYTLSATGRYRATPRLGLLSQVRWDQSDGWTDAHDLDRTTRRITARSDPRATEKLHLLGGVDYRASDHHSLRARVRLFRGRTEQDKISTRAEDAGRTRGTEDALDLDATLAWTYVPGKGGEIRTTAHVFRRSRTQLDRQTATVRRSGRLVGDLLTDDVDDIVDTVSSVGSIYRQRVGEDHLVTSLLQVRRQARASDNQKRRTERDPEGNVVTDADFFDPAKVYSMRETIFAAALQDAFQIAPPLTWTFGARGESSSLWGNVLTPATTFSVRVVPELTLRYSVGAGYKTPSFDALARPATPDLDVASQKYLAGNPDLRPERSIAQDFGFLFLWPAPDPASFGRRASERPAPSAERVRAGLSFFQNAFRDKIQKQITDDWQGSGLQLERDINLGRVTTRGFEAELAARPFELLELGINYTHLRARNEDLGARLDRTSDHAVNTMVRITVPELGTRVVATWRYTSAAPRIDANGFPLPEGPVPVYSVVDLFVTQPFGKHLEGLLQVFNVLGARWDKDNDGDTDLWPINVFIGIRGRV